jgi:hypothetical protein
LGSTLKGFKPISTIESLGFGVFRVNDDVFGGDHLSGAHTPMKGVDEEQFAQTFTLHRKLDR